MTARPRHTLARPGDISFPAGVGNPAVPQRRVAPIGTSPCGPREVRHSVDRGLVLLRWRLRLACPGERSAAILAPTNDEEVSARKLVGVRHRLDSKGLLPRERFEELLRERLIAGSPVHWRADWHIRRWRQDCSGNAKTPLSTQRVNCGVGVVSMRAGDAAEGVSDRSCSSAVPSATGQRPRR